MNDLKSNDGETKVNAEAAQAESNTPDIARRSAVTYLAMGMGLAAVGFLAPQRAHAAYGKCYKCNCCGFEGNQNNCSNCGHQYSDHTGQTCDKDR
jgi:hypothetical protein